MSDDRYTEDGYLKKKDPESFVAGDFAAAETAKMKGETGGGEVVTNTGGVEVRVPFGSEDEDAQAAEQNVEQGADAQESQAE